jgi:RND family efflux transporter MFP subunit
MSTATHTPPPPPPDADFHDPDAIPTDLPQVRTWSVALAGVVLVACLVGLFFLGWVPRQKRLAALNEEVAAVTDVKPAVDVALPKRTANTLDLALPADARANQETSLFPRSSGYLKRFLVDVGDKVTANQLLAEIDAPDIDAELVQAKASVVEARANVVRGQNDVELSQATLTRYEGFAKTGGVTRQQLDERRATLTQAQSSLEAAKASVQVAEATVQRLTALQGFTKIYAPFAGTVTARNFDVGALTSANQTTPLFRIADTETLRVFVNVPQSYVQSVRPGQKVTLAVRNYPGREFAGVVARTTGALDPATRTLRYQVDVPNQDGTLFAGMFGEVRIKTTRETPPLTVPTSAVVFDSAGTRVWVVDAGKAKPIKVDVGRDFGTEIEIATGLQGAEQVITNPGSTLAEGADVVAQLPPQQQQGGPAQPRQAAAR